MNIITSFIIAAIVILLYYILKFYYNHKMKLILIIVNCVSILIIIIDYIFIGSQELFDNMFALECLIIVVCFYYLFDKSNYELYSILAKTSAIPIMIGSSCFLKGKREIKTIIEFFNSNNILMNKNKDIHIILVDKDKKNVEVLFVFRKRADIDYYKANIVNNIPCTTNYSGRLLTVSFDRNS